MILLPLACILAVSHMVETMTGFGATVLALSLGVHFVPLEQWVVALVLVAWIQSVWILVRGFRSIRWRLLLARILPLGALGLPLGAWCFRALGGEELRGFLGVFVIGISGMELFRLFRSSERTRRLWPPAGMALLGGGGFFHGMFASGGPLIVAYAGREIEDKGGFRATLSVLWILMNSYLILSYALSGRMEGDGPRLALSLLPAVAIGILLGEILHARVNEMRFRKVVQVVLFFTGISLLV